jgi:hypothetical protein
MHRGRHRNSQPLHRLLPSLLVAGSAAVFAAGTWAVSDPVVLRVMAAGAAVAAIFGGVLLRRWDRSAGKRIADIEAARVRDEWHTDERIAELEVDIEDSREIRGRLENKLHAKRAELARLRSEHAGLLRRYATAESQRASTLEDRRQLVIGGATSPRPAPTSPAVYLQADEALRNLGRNAARQQALHTVEEARRRDVKDSADEPRGRHAASPGTTPASPGLPVRQHQLIPAVAAAVLPYAKPHHAASRTLGGFDFFGTQKTAGEAPVASDAADDPSHFADGIGDGIGDETVAEQQGVDLADHDESEQIEVVELRLHSS